jgi:hypothetical protein
MNLHRLGSALVAVVAAVSMGACGGGDEGGVTPTGPHYKYVINKIAVPTSATQTAQFGLDIDGNGAVDNSLGGALVLIAGLGFDIQAAIDRGILGGKLIALADVQTPDFNSAEGAGIEFFLGDNPQPAACSGASDVVNCTDAKPSVCSGCGKHLSNGSFSIAAASPNDGAITGKIKGGTFTGGPGKMTLLISVGDAAPIRFDLIGARVKATGMNESAIGSGSEGLVLAGAVTQESLDATVLPGFQAQLNDSVDKGCKTKVPPNCGCTLDPAGKTGRQILDTLDLDPKNCTVSVAELQAKVPLLLKQDVTIDGKPAYSAGVKATAVKAMFAAPGE